MPVPKFPTDADAAVEEGFVSSRDGTRLYWRRYRPPSPRGAVALLHGGGDHLGRYPGITGALVRAGFAVALVDFRGHGRSEGRRWHVGGWEEYLEDVDALWPLAREGAPWRPAFVVAHSQGALVALGWALSRKPELAGMVLSSPFLGLAFAPPRAKVLAARLLARVVPWLPLSTGLKIEDLTGDEDHRRWTEADPLYGTKATPGWFVASEGAQREVLARAGELSAPLLVLAAGADAIADARLARRLVDAAGSADKEVRELPGLRHEIWNEVGREQPISAAVEWLAARAPRGGETS